MHSIKSRKPLSLPPRHRGAANSIKSLPLRRSGYDRVSKHAALEMKAACFDPLSYPLLFGGELLIEFAAPLRLGGKPSGFLLLILCV